MGGSALTNDAEGSRGNEFSSDWTSHHFELWTRVLAPLRERATEILEVGSYEGRSATFFLEYLPTAKIVCVDRFAQKTAPGYARRFRHNMARFGSRVEPIRGEAMVVLHSLLPNPRRFDLIYIDGSHCRDDVLIDTLLCWRLLRVGGLLIWDDYALDISPFDGPQAAIDIALHLYSGTWEQVHRGQQVIVRKTGERKSYFLAEPRPTPATVRRFLTGRLGVPRTPGNLLRVLLGRLG
jgi:predicted O-methyltransferase YrrM